MAAPDATESVLGQTLDNKYRIDQLIGRGGMGAVYKAEHVGTGRPVAVKTILPRLVTNLDSIERFRREARAAGGLRHPNIVDVTDFGVAEVKGEKVAYLVMEYLEGSTLQAFIKESGALPVEVVVDVIEQIALALDVAHRIGIVHRDLKPDNIWLVPDARGGHVVRILDFGIAKLRDAESDEDSEPVDATTSDPTSLTPDVATAIRTHEDERTDVRAPEDEQTAIRGEEDLETAVRAEPAVVMEVRTPTNVSTSATDDHESEDEETEVRTDSSGTPSAQLTTAGMTLGTPAYMSPEQCRTETVDARSDIYSLGIVAWQALTGERPFKGSYFELVRQHTEQPAPRVDEANPAVSKNVADAVAVALEKNPDERYQSAGAMAGSIRVAAEGASVVLRNAAALYIHHFESFFAISLRAARPALVLLALVALSVPFLGDSGFETMYLVIAGPILWSIATLMTHAVFSSVVERLRTQPLSPVSADAVFGDVNRRLGLAEGASIWATCAKLSVFYTHAEMKASPGMGDLAFQIAFHEGRAPNDVGDRTRLLARATKKTFDWVRFVILATVLIIPLVEGCVLFTLGTMLRLHTPDVALGSVVIVLLSFPLIAVVTNPMLSPALAVLYFRARQANGEDVGLSAVIPSRL